MGVPTREAPKGPHGPLSWAGNLAIASLALCVGSGVLFLGAFLTPMTPEAWVPVFLYFCGWFALLFHVLGWMLLAFGIREASGSTPSHRGMTGAFLFSLAVFILGIATLPSAIPRFADNWSFLLTVMPYVPSVWAPVVLCHATLFAFGLKDVPIDERAWVTRFSILLLVAIAVLAVAVQLSVSPLDTPWIHAPLAYALWLFAGLTAVGYAGAASGWRRTWLARTGPRSTPKAPAPPA